MDKLLVSSRATRLQSLQALAEMQEYIKFRSESGWVSLSSPLSLFFLSTFFTSPCPSGNFESTAAVEQLLTRWRSRLPHPQKDSVSVWDDIVTGRCMMMRKLLEHFHTLPHAVRSAGSQYSEAKPGLILSLSPLLPQFHSRQ